MEGVARARYLRQSAQKINRELSRVRGQDVNQALNILHFSTTKASVFIEKTMRSAVANIMTGSEGKEVDIDTLYVKKAYVDSGPSFKRWRARARGRADRILKRTSHLTVVIAQKSS